MSISDRFNRAETRKLEEFPGYIFCDDGNVWSTHKRTRGGHIKSRLKKMTPDFTKSGPLRWVALVVNGMRQKRLLHQLILRAFSGDCPAGHMPHWINGDKADNRVSNLVWLDVGIVPHPVLNLYGTNRAGNVFSRSVANEWRPVKRHLLNGYVYYRVRNEHGIASNKTGHELVLETFVCLRPDGMQGCHNDGNKSNNAIVNLRWGTPKENNADKKTHGTQPQGETHYLSKLTDEDVREIRRLMDSGSMLNDVATLFNITASNVRYIAKRKTWKHVI